MMICGKEKGRDTKEGKSIKRMEGLDRNARYELTSWHRVLVFLTTRCGRDERYQGEGNRLSLSPSFLIYKHFELKQLLQKYDSEEGQNSK